MHNRAAKVRLGEPIDLGEVVVAQLGQAAAIGTRRNGANELYFISNGSPATFYAANLETGCPTFEFEIPHSEAVWGMTVTPEGHVYFAGTEDGVLYRFLPEERTVELTGQLPVDPWVWDLKASQDGNIYGATYPKAKVFEYNPSSRQFRDLGRMSDQEQYARGVAAAQDKLYIGIGSTIHLICLDRATGMLHELMLEGYTGKKGFVDRIWPYGNVLFISIDQSTILVYFPDEQRIVHQFQADNFVSSALEMTDKFYYIYNGMLFTYSLITNESSPCTALPSAGNSPKVKCMQWISTRLNQIDSRQILAIVNSNADIYLYDLMDESIQELRLNIPEKPVALQSLESDGNGRLYIGGYHRSLTIYNTRDRLVEHSIPRFPQTEGIGFLNGKVYFGTYTKARIFRYDPDREVEPQWSPNSNPSLVWKIGHQQDRPFSFASGDGKLFIGTIPDYGLLTGALTVYDEREDHWDVYSGLVPNQSIVGLAFREGLLYGGTSNWGGFGIEPTETIAKMFVWDVEEEKLVTTFAPDIPGIDMPPRMIGELTFGKDGLLWGAADGTIFAICTKSLKVLKSKVVFPSEYKYSHIRPYFLRWSPSGLLFTSLARKLVVIDTQTMEHKVLDHEPLALMTLGVDGNIYYNRGSRLMTREVRII